MGLPRSNLVKSKSSDVAFAAAAVPSAPQPVASLGAPFAAASTMAGLGAPPAFAPFTPDRTLPLAFGPFVAPAAAVALGEATLREPLHTSPDCIEVELPPASRGPYASAISTNELLERAAALGPARMSWESIVLPDDPILDEKRRPHVAERRERFTRMVKIGLGACVAVCAIALGVSTLSGPSSSSGSASASSAALGKMVPSKGVVPIEALDGTKHAKAARRVAPTVATAAIVRAKRR